MAMIKNIVQPFVVDPIQPVTPSGSGSDFFGGGFNLQASAVTLPTSTVNFGVLANVPYGSGYGYVAGRFARSSVISGGSNPSPANLTILTKTLPHPYIGDYAQYGNRIVRIEIDFDVSASDHPASDWLTSLKIDDGQGNSNTFDMSNFTRANHTGNAYYPAGAEYRRTYGTGYPSLVDTTNNAKTLTWEFV